MLLLLLLLLNQGDFCSMYVEPIRNLLLLLL
jgi:hypothetical protein